MTIRSMRVPFLDVEDVKMAPFTVVECGARDASIDEALRLAFPRASIIGFEADAEEARRLESVHGESYVSLPAAVAGTSERRVLNLTAHPACSSLFEPDESFWSAFREGPSFAVRRTVELDTVTLDSYLPGAGIDRIDFLKLDVQGAEMEILQGAERFLSNTVLGILCEVEFAQMYRGQPLFADVDVYLRSLGFVLFDLSRTRYVRKSLPQDGWTRGQILWGDAVYFRDYRPLVETGKIDMALKLAVLASVHGFHDYALEIVDRLVAADSPLDPGSRQSLTGAKQRYIDGLQAVPMAAPPDWRWKLIDAVLSFRLARKVAESAFMAFRTVNRNIPLDRGLSTGTHWDD